MKKFIKCLSLLEKLSIKSINLIIRNKILNGYFLKNNKKYRKFFTEYENYNFMWKDRCKQKLSKPMIKIGGSQSESHNEYL